MANASQISNYIIQFFQEAGDPVTNLKLQKLLYYVQGWSLALRDEAAFNEQIEAWVHGPVQPSIYRQYQSYRWNPINEEVIKPSLDADLANLIDEVLGAYGMDSGYELELRTHQEPPWIDARKGVPADEPSNEIISHDAMSSYFKTLAQN